MNYQDFLESKKHLTGNFGFDANYIPDVAFDFQKHIIEKAVKKGRIGLFIDTGLGKTLIQLSIAKNILNHTNKRVLILTPLAVGFQFLQEAEDKKITDDIYQTKKGEFNGKNIIVCNYERLHYLNSKDFEAVILDESSILKNFNGKIKSQITSFLRNIKYRFLATATPSPNDYIEFGTSSEALGYMPYMDMLQKFFANKENNFKPQDIGSKWYLKPHAKNDFFSWVNTWSFNVKMPSDLGYSDKNYILPKLIENKHYVKNNNNWVIQNQIQLFNGIAKSMSEVRSEQKGTIQERCEKAVELANEKTSVYWTHFNDEADTIEALDKDAVQVKGGDSVDKKESILIDFAKGNIKRLITKPKITSFGLNWQHCNHTVYFPTWSYEQYYQSIRRFWRFGQKNDVTVDLVLSDGQKRVIDTLNFKSNRAKEFRENLKNNLAKNVDIEIKQYKSLTLPKF